MALTTSKKWSEKEIAEAIFSTDFVLILREDEELAVDERNLRVPISLLSAALVGTLWGGEWTFADNGGGFPEATLAGTDYVVTDDHGAPGDADYVPAGTWMKAKVAGANSFAQYYLK